MAKMSPIQVTRNHQGKTIPESFDTREKWPYLRDLQIRDQENCAASWIFSATGVASDRLAIQTHGEYISLLSAQHVLSCGQRRNRNGCNGDHMDWAWHFMRRNEWGEKDLENSENVKYWVCANSWGTQWGEEGYFKLERGNLAQLKIHNVATHLSAIEYQETPDDFPIIVFTRLRHPKVQVIDILWKKVPTFMIVKKRRLISPT